MIFWNMISALIVGFGWGALAIKASTSANGVSNESIYFMIAASTIVLLALVVINSPLAWKEPQ